MTRVCADCSETLPITAFPFAYPGLRRRQCKPCFKKRDTLRKHRNRSVDVEAFREKERVLNRKKYLMHRDENIKRLVKQGNSPKGKARRLLRDAVISGTITKPKTCSNCSKVVPANRIHGHHEDYSKPLSVHWLCAVCHANVHLGRISLAILNERVK